MNYEIVERVYGFATALTPIQHGEIPSYQESISRLDKDKGKAVRFRKMPFLVEDRESKIQRNMMLPVISGNAVRGVGRRLLTDFTLQALGLAGPEFGKLFKSANIANDMLYFMRSGGATAKGDQADLIDSETFYKISESFPIWSLLGGSYHGHMFEGQCRIGIMIPLTTETKLILKRLARYELILKGFDMEDEEWEDFELTASEIAATETMVSRYMRKAEKGEPEEEETTPTAAETEQGDEGTKRGSVFSFEVVPAGTRFMQVSVLVGGSEMNRLAFRAMNAMVSLRGILGGNSSKGHGMAAIKYLNEEFKEYDRVVIEEYRNYLEKNCEQLKQALIEFSEKITYHKKEPKNSKQEEDAANTDKSKKKK